MKTKRTLRRELEAERWANGKLLRQLEEQRSASELLAEAYRAQIDGLQSVYNDLHQHHLKMLEADYKDLMLDSAIIELKQSNDELARKFMRILDIINGREDFHSEIVTDSS